jgi:energy-coupling factor transporter ATP-binding protein EcfA2
MVDRVELLNFKLLRDVQVDLGRLNVFVGRNGVGKSSVLRGLDLLMWTHGLTRGKTSSTETNALRFEQNFSPVVSRPDANNVSVRARIGLLGIQVYGQFQQANNDLNVDFMRGSWDRRDPEGLTGFGAGVAAPYKFPSVDRLPATRALYLDAAAIRAPHNPTVDPPTISANGEGVSSALLHLHGLRDGRLEALEADLAKIVKGVKRVRALPIRYYTRELESLQFNGRAYQVLEHKQVNGTRFEVELDGVGWLPAQALSEGTVLALALVTVLHYEQPSTLLLDDLDKGLHPLAQRELIELLRRLLAQHPELQVLATSHSPFLLDSLSPDEVFVVGSVSPQESRVRRLDTHPKFTKYRDVMDSGALWSHLGEDWVAEEPA